MLCILKRLCLVFVLAGAASAAAAAEPDGVPADFSLRLSRGGCEGACPTYNITVDREGVVRWQGERFVHRMGAASKRIERRVVQAMVRGVRTRSILLLKPGKCPCIDLPLTEITLTLEGRSTYVAYCLGDQRPEARRLNAFAAFVDETLSDQAWVGGAEDRRMH